MTAIEPTRVISVKTTIIIAHELRKQKSRYLL